MELEEFINISKESLKKEREADIHENKQILETSSPKDLQLKGLCLLKLKIERKYIGLFGRTVIKLQHLKEMPVHSFSNGDIVSIASSNESISATGVISKVTPTSVSVAFEDETDSLDLDDSLIYKCTKMANDVTYKRLNKVLSHLEKTDNILLDIAFGTLRMPESNFKDYLDLNWFNMALDSSQKDAVRFCLQQNEMAIIHGPPGTGKTTTLIEVIKQLVALNKKILVCAQSNIAVDNLVERLVTTKGDNKKKINLVRLGHPARLLPSIKNYSLDSMISNSDDSDIVKDVRLDINKNLVSLKSCRNKFERSRVKDELRHLKKELKIRQEKMVRDILKSCSVVLGTLTSVSMDGPLGLLLGEGSCNQKLVNAGNQFDVVVIDECSQALEIACWIGLLWGKKCVLAGDHHQLPPTIITNGPEKKILEVTLMERLIAKFGNNVVQMLTTQYRMHEDIMRWSSDKLYGGKLMADNSVSSHLLSHLENVIETEETKSPLLLIDTAGCMLYETSPDDKVSKGNEGEAMIVEAHVKSLVESGIKQHDIAIIVPYNFQAEIIRLKISKSYPSIETRTVDGFQGREKEAVILSFVRSNSEGQVGFLADYRRINVAVTRARRHLCVICDSSTVCRDDFIKSLIDHINSNGNVRSAHEYSNEFIFTMKQINEKPKQLKQKTLNNKEDDHQDKWNYFDKLLRDFIKNKDNKIYSFDPNLNSHDRLLVHQISELLNLKHESQGEGAERHIVVSKFNDVTPSKFRGNIINSLKIAEKTVNESPELIMGEQGLLIETSTNDKDFSPNISNDKSICDSIDNIIEGSNEIIYNHDHVTSNSSLIDNLKLSNFSGLSEKNDGNSEVLMGPISNIKVIKNLDSSPLVTDRYKINANDFLDESNLHKCVSCGAKVPKGNIELHELHCQSKQKLLVIPTKIHSSNKKSTLKKSDKKVAISIDGDDFYSLIDSAIKDNNKCHFVNCKSITTLLGQICPFCKVRFCLTHSLPEVHGCGDAVKISARQRISRDGIITPGSGAPYKHSDVIKHDQLKKKFSKKMVNMENSRKAKTKEETKK